MWGSDGAHSSPKLRPMLEGSKSCNENLILDI
jgi:hypothetical protein